MLYVWGYLGRKAQRMSSSSMSDLTECEFCLGAKGGVPGNENVIGGVVVCDYCHVLLQRVTRGGRKDEEDLRLPEFEIDRLRHALRLIAFDPGFKGYQNEFGDDVDPRAIARTALRLEVSEDL